MMVFLQNGRLRSSCARSTCGISRIKEKLTRTVKVNPSRRETEAHRDAKQECSRQSKKRTPRQDSGLASVPLGQGLAGTQKRE